MSGAGSLGLGVEFRPRAATPGDGVTIKLFILLRIHFPCISSI